KKRCLSWCASAPPMERITNRNLVNDLLVMIFGGTSMGSDERIRVAARLAAEQSARRPVVVVVSAMSKVTDLLLDSLRKAEAGDRADLDANLEKLSDKHREACCGLLPKEKQDEAIAGLEGLITEFA